MGQPVILASSKSEIDAACFSFPRKRKGRISVGRSGDVEIDSDVRAGVGSGFVIDKLGLFKPRLLLREVLRRTEPSGF